MNYNLKSFKRYQKEYGGSYLSYDFNEKILDRIYEMASVEEGEEYFNETSYMYETECKALWEEKNGTIHSFSFTKAVSCEKMDEEVYDFDENGNPYVKGYRSHLDDSFIPKY